MVITKDTQAFVGDHASWKPGQWRLPDGILTVPQQRQGRCRLTVSALRRVQGVAVQAQSAENLFVIGASEAWVVRWAGGGVTVKSLTRTPAPG